MDHLKKLMAKKKGDMPAHERQAKMDVLKDLRDQAASAMAGGLHGLKKVSVMSDSPEGLSEGLDKAKHIAEGAEEDREHALHEPEMDDAAEEDAEKHEGEEAMGAEHDEALSPEAAAHEEEAEHEGREYSHDELDAEIAKLMELKRNLHSNR